jgi:hypothetical protein
LFVGLIPVNAACSNDDESPQDGQSPRSGHGRVVAFPAYNVEIRLWRLELGDAVLVANQFCDVPMGDWSRYRATWAVLVRRFRSGVVG